MNDTPSPTSNSQPASPYPFVYVRPQDDDIRLLDLFRILMRYKGAIVGITLLALIVGVAIAFLTKPTYRADVLLAPVSDDDSGIMRGIASPYAGIASLAGINLGSTGSSAEQAIAIIESRKFISEFVDEKQLIPVLFTDKWDKNSKKWNVDVQEKPPSLLDAYALFSTEILEVSSDKKTGLVTLSVEWTDPKLAAAWANELVERINKHEKQKAIKEAELSISYLKEQLVKTSALELQQVIFRLMEAQTKKIMLANVRDQYAFKVIDPAVIPERKIKPNRKIVIGVGVVIGFLSSLLLVFVVSAIRNQLSKDAKSTF